MTREEREQLAARHTPLVWSIVRRYIGRGVETDDLFQLGSLGLLKAIDGFDENFGVQFSTYAVPKIAGEIRRFLRDDGTVKVSRTLREQAYALEKARQVLTQELGREPLLSELAQRTGMTAEEAALCASAPLTVSSLDEPLGEDGGTLLDLCGQDEEDRVVDRIALREAMKQLDAPERAVLDLRYFRDMTQQKTGEALGLSQVKVSRTEKKALQKLRALLI